MAMSLMDREDEERSGRAKSFERRWEVAAGGRAGEGGNNESISSRMIKLGLFVSHQP